MATNKEVSRHSNFHISTVTFLVEDSLFRVPREPFQQESEGSSDENPIRLNGTSKDDFEQLLKALFYRKHSLQPTLPHSIEQWTSVLKLSTLWSFEKLCQASIDMLTTSGIGAIDRVVLSQQYGIKSWLLP
ncbi:hypothetical protein EDC04DRAFT_380979 [Pisolithus marmoratus]|nr:hypothetical protein EDC04DRAFT_380979 [Pisolithus marmoratus]